MFALPGLLALIFVEYLRPQAYVPGLRGLPLLHLATGLAVLGFILDLRLGLSRLRAAPHLVLTLLFLAWCLITVLVRAPDQLLPRASALLIPIAIYLLVAHGIQSFRRFQTVCALLLAISLTLAAFGIYQALAPTACFRTVTTESYQSWTYDGRPCTVRLDCEGEGAEPGADYACERLGLFGTSSVAGRVRWTGTLQDPNELSLVLCIALPFALAFLERRRSLGRRLLAIVAVGAIGLCTTYTQSRGGQLIFLTVVAVHFGWRIGWKRGLVYAGLIALPLLALGGRSGGDAASSTSERLECWWVGLHMLVSSPVFGVGSGQFTEHHYITAHNSYVLAAAELGLPGLLLWSSVIYMAAKIPFTTLRRQVAPVARTWALALLSSMAGLLIGILFLSFIYKDVLWVYVGLTGVLYQAIRRHDPHFRISFTIRDFRNVAVIDIALLVALIAHTSRKLGW